MCSMWTAQSDLDYYAQFKPDPPEDEDPNPKNPKSPKNCKPTGMPPTKAIAGTRWRLKPRVMTRKMKASPDASRRWPPNPTTSTI
jgi:hypothetical protein